MERLTVDAEQQTENFSLHSGREQLSEGIGCLVIQTIVCFYQSCKLIATRREQRFGVTASEDGMSDYNCIDVIREAKATVVAVAQSSTSFIPPLGREKARVFTLNLRNRLIFKAADEEAAVERAPISSAKNG